VSGRARATTGSGDWSRRCGRCRARW
jgi:hypothetical protein